MKAHPQRILQTVFLLISSVAALASCATAPPKPETVALGEYDYTKQYTSWLIQKEMKKAHVTCLSIALVDDQRVIWAQGFGYADEANKVPAAPETGYRVGSISKLFTATAVMQLSEQGKVDIDQPLQIYLPEFSMNTRFPESSPITPRHLLTHHSGLPANLNKGMWTKTPEPFTKVVSEIKEEYTAYPPNFVFAYSNLGVTLLGAAVEKVSGNDFVSHIDESVLRPLGMIDSSFSSKPEIGFSKGYLNGKETNDPPLRDLPSGGLQSTVLDLSRFIQMVFAEGRSGERQILKPETLAEMLRPQNTDVPLDLNFHVGLGWMLSGLGEINLQNAGPVSHHGGATLLFHSQLILLPEHKLGVVVLANSSTARSVVDHVATEAIKLALETKTGIKQPRPMYPEEDNRLQPQVDLQAYEGQYATLLGPARITKKGSSLWAEVMDRTFHLVPRADGLLAVKYKLFGLIPIRLGDLDSIGIARATVEGHEILLARSGRQDLLIGEKITPLPISEKWLQRLGEYQIANPGEDTLLFDQIRLREGDCLLLLEYSLPYLADAKMRFALSPISDTEAVIFGLGGGMGETIRVTRVEGEERLLYSGYQMKRKVAP